MKNHLPVTHKTKVGATYEIRQARPDDAEALLAFIEDVSGESEFLTFGPGEFDLTVEEERRFLQDNLERKNHVYLVAVQKDEIIGVLNFSGGSRSRVQHRGEFGLSVRQAAWGLGIGSHLLETLIQWARESDLVTKINLRVRSDNERAIALYKQKGFAIEGTLRREICIDGVYYDHYWMGLEL